MPATSLKPDKRAEALDQSDSYLPRPGFNGQWLDPSSGYYLLGNGYRAFNPVLMRFNRPDNLSPFGAAGINTYMYCQADPVNQVDPGGSFALFQTIEKVVFTEQKQNGD